MDTKTRARFEARADIIKAMAHPSRLYMVHALADGERCVCELADLLEADMSTVSKHLSVLRSAGIVRDEKRGLQVYYSLRCPCILNFFDCLEGVLRAQAKERAEALL